MRLAVALLFHECDGWLGRLVINRLKQIMKRQNFTNLEQYINYVKNDKSGDAMGELANRITTNHTYFNRENLHFNFFEKTVLPDICDQVARRKEKKDLRVWCAGCSSGEEAYTLMGTILNFFSEKPAQWDLGLLATDISKVVLNLARAGQYPIPEIKKLDSRLWPYFNKQGLHGIASDKLKKEITFRRFNLVNNNYPFKKKFHCIFCRNVMIYFDQNSRRDQIKRFYDNLHIGAYLFIGHSETIPTDDNPGFEHLGTSIYRKVE